MSRLDKISQNDINKLVDEVKKMPGAGDQQHVAAQFPIYGKPIPDTPKGSWEKAKLKFIKFKKLEATNGQLDRANLIWHLQNPGKAKFRKTFSTHPQVMKTNGGDYIIVDGHHRLSALRMLGVKKDVVWLLKERNL